MPNWLDRLLGPQPAAPRTESAYSLRAFAEDPDPWVKLQRLFGQPANWGRMFLAASREQEIITTTDRRHCLILGPPRSFKSTGILFPQILCHPGPVVSTSTKPDAYRATAVARSRRGNLWHLALDENGTLPGALPLRWSPVTAAGDWGRAQAAGHGMASTSEVAAGSENANYFRLRAGELLSMALHAAALGGKELAWVLSVIDGSAYALSEAEAILERKGHPLSIGPLRQIMSMDSRGREPITSTAQTALVAYRDPQGYESTLNPNFDPDAFVAGQPDVLNLGLLPGDDVSRRLASMTGRWPTGLYDTLYITSGTLKQARLAPAITAILGAIREAAFRLSGQQELGRAQPRPTTLWALDEVAQVAPLADLPETASQGAGQGLLMSIVLQDLSQAEKRWKEEAKGFGSLFGDLVMFPGIGNHETTQRISDLIGKDWHSRTQVSHSGQQGKGGSMTFTGIDELLPLLAPEEINRGGGVNAGELDPRRVLVVKQGGVWGWGFSLPYFNSPPFAQALVSSMWHHVDEISHFELREMVPMPRFYGQNASTASEKLAETKANLLHAADQGYVDQFVEDYRDAWALQEEEGDHGVTAFLASTPLMKEWVGAQPFRVSVREPLCSLVVSDEWLDVAALFEGFALESSTVPIHGLEAQPDQVFGWKLEAASMTIGLYSSPNAVWALVRELEAARPEAEPRWLSRNLYVPPASALVIASEFAIGEFVASKIAEQIQSPLFLNPQGEVERR